MEGQSPEPHTSPPSSPLSSISGQPSPPAVKPRFTRATVVNRQLPLLHGLEPTTRNRSTRPQRVLQRQPSFTLSSDSSCDEKRAYTQQKQPSVMSTTATVEPTSGKAPVLTSGDVTPSVMMEFENACHDFFEAKSVPQDKQVAFILPGIRDLRIRNWIAADRPTIVALPFASFMTQLRSNYLYFLMPHRFLQECIHSAGFHRIPQESTGIHWNGTGIQCNEPGFHWIVTEGTCLSACKYKCVYINRLCGLSVSLSLSRYTLPFLGQISHDTMIVALSLTFPTILKSSYLVLFLWGKMQKD